MTVCVSHYRDCALFMVQYYIYYLFLSMVKAHTDLRKNVLSRIIIPGRFMTRVVNQCWRFTPGHNSTWMWPVHNYSTCGIRRLGIFIIQQLDQQKSIEYWLGVHIQFGPKFILHQHLKSNVKYKRTDALSKWKWYAIVSLIVSFIIYAKAFWCLRFHAKMK